jgi:phage-related protein
VYQLWYIVFMHHEPLLQVVFYKTGAGKEPVRDWLKSLPLVDRKSIGEDIKTVQFGWPLGMPLVRKLEAGLWEVRSNTSGGIARVLFTVQSQYLILLHGFTKKSAKTPLETLALARKRLRQVQGDE